MAFIQRSSEGREPKARPGPGQKNDPVLDKRVGVDFSYLFPLFYIAMIF